MASVDEQSPTMVTGSPVEQGRGARPGDVLCERYEVVERTSRDAFVINHRAQDQETEKACVVRIIEPALLEGTTPRAIADKLKGAVGVGNKFLPGLLDVDVDESGRLFVVEPEPIGASLREVLSSRRARGDTLSAAEVLPVVARLAAAIAAIPPPFHHGDVRLDRVWLAEDGLAIAFPFVLGVLPPSAVAAATAGDPVLGATVAPELSRGMIGDAADRFGVACIAYETLTGRLPVSGAPMPAKLGKIGDALTRLLHPKPKNRPRDLGALLNAISKAAGLPVPQLEAHAYKRTRRGAGNPVSGLLLPPDDLVEPTPMGARRERQRPSMDTIEESRADLVDSTSKTAPMSEAAAAQVLGGGAEQESSGTTAKAEVKPPLAVASATETPDGDDRDDSDDGYDDEAYTIKASPLSRGDTADYDNPEAPLPDEITQQKRGGLPEGAATGGTQEIRADELEAIEEDGDEKTAKPKMPARKRGGLPEGAATGGTQEIRADELEPIEEDDDDEPAPAPAKEGTQQVRAEDILEVRDDGDGDGNDDHDGDLRAATPAKEGTQQVRAEDILEARSLGRDPSADDRLAPELLAAALANKEAASSASQANEANDASDDDDDAVALPLSKAKRLPPAPSKPAGPKPMPVPAGKLPPAPRATPDVLAPKIDAAPVSTPPPPSSSPPPAAGPPRRDPTPRVVKAKRGAPTGEYDDSDLSSIGDRNIDPYAHVRASRRRSALGKWILVGAVGLAILIVLGGVLIAQRRRDAAERERRLQDRFLELQQESSGETPAAP